MSFKQFAGYLRNETEVILGNETEVIKTIFVSLATSFLLLVFLYYFKLRFVDDFLPKYGFFLFFSILSYAIVLPSMRQVRAYKNFACMTGMMIGMTIGMLAGFLSGFFVGATNGMFYGSVLGMGLGIIFGIYNGKCCGIMGVMEGIMAGFMGGLMGAMTSVMLYNDNLKIGGVIVFAISAVISVGLNYMIYHETREVERQHKDSELFVIVWSFILTALTTWLMVFGPRSVLFQ